MALIKDHRFREQNKWQKSEIKNLLSFLYLILINLLDRAYATPDWPWFQTPGRWHHNSWYFPWTPPSPYPSTHTFSGTLPDSRAYNSWSCMSCSWSGTTHLICAWPGAGPGAEPRIIWGFQAVASCASRRSGIRNLGRCSCWSFSFWLNVEFSRWVSGVGEFAEVVMIVCSLSSCYYATRIGYWAHCLHCRLTAQ